MYGPELLRRLQSGAIGRSALWALRELCEEAEDVAWESDVLQIDPRYRLQSFTIW